MDYFLTHYFANIRCRISFQSQHFRKAIKMQLLYTFILIYLGICVVAYLQIYNSPDRIG